MFRKFIQRFAPAAVVLLALTSCAETPTSIPSVQSSSTPSYTVVRESLPADLLPGVSLSGIIGITGGSISLAGHVLEVPAGAVTVPTLFTLTVPLNGYVQVDLSATVTTILGKVVDVGALGFQKPVKLSLTYARATNVSDPKSLFVAYMPNGDHSKLEKLPSTLHATKKLVSAQLGHFSKYCMASD